MTLRKLNHLSYYRWLQRTHQDKETSSLLLLWAQSLPVCCSGSASSSNDKQTSLHEGQGHRRSGLAAAASDWPCTSCRSQVCKSTALGSAERPGDSRAPLHGEPGSGHHFPSAGEQCALAPGGAEMRVRVSASAHTADRAQGQLGRGLCAAQPVCGQQAHRVLQAVCTAPWLQDGFSLLPSPYGEI